MNLREQVRRRCEERCVIFDNSDELTKISPGVYLFSAYDIATKRMRNYKAIDKSTFSVIEYY